MNTNCFVRIITNSDSTELETQICHCLERYKDCNLIDIKYSTFVVRQSIKFSAMIIFSKKEDMLDE